VVPSFFPYILRQQSIPHVQLTFSVVGPDIDDEEDAAEDFEPDDDEDDDDQVDDGKRHIFLYPH